MNDHLNQSGGQGHNGHGWMMLICCVPMLAIAIALVALGVVSPAFILLALLCVGMMALMMVGMGGSDHKGM